MQEVDAKVSVCPLQELAEKRADPAEGLFLSLVCGSLQFYNSCP